MSVFVVVGRGDVGDDLQGRGVFSSLGVPKVEGVEELDRWEDCSRVEHDPPLRLLRSRACTTFFVFESPVVTSAWRKTIPVTAPEHSFPNLRHCEHAGEALSHCV